MLFKHFAGLDAFPICVETQEVEAIIQLVKNIAPVFGGVNLEDISAPRCFEIEDRLQDIGIPVFHDDQHGTAVVTLAGLLNACKVLNKKMSDLSVVVNGSGAAGGAIARLLTGHGNDDPSFEAVKSVVMCDTKGIIHAGRTDLTPIKQNFLTFTNKENKQGNLFDAMRGADVFVGVRVANLLTAKDISLMNPNSIIFALANPIPEIMPEEAYKGGAAIVGTGRSDLPNQVNNVLGYPGIFKGALEVRAKQITMKMKIAAAKAIANCVKKPHQEYIIPSPLEKRVVKAVAEAVKNAI